MQYCSSLVKELFPDSRVDRMGAMAIGAHGRIPGLLLPQQSAMDRAFFDLLVAYGSAGRRART